MNNNIKIGIIIFLIVATLMISKYAEAEYHKGDVVAWSGDDWINVNESDGKILGTIQVVYHGTGMYEIKLHPYYMYETAYSTHQYPIEFIDRNTELVT